MRLTQKYNPFFCRYTYLFIDVVVDEYVMYEYE